MVKKCNLRVTNSISFDKTFLMYNRRAQWQLLNIVTLNLKDKYFPIIFIYVSLKSKKKKIFA